MTTQILVQIPAGQDQGLDLPNLELQLQGNLVQQVQLDQGQDQEVPQGQDLGAQQGLDQEAQQNQLVLLDLTDQGLEVK